MYTRLFTKTCAYAPAYLHVCMANVHALMSNTHSHASNLLGVPSSNTHSNRLWNVGTTWRPVLFSFDTVHFPLGTAKENICVWNTLKVQGIIHFWASWWKKISKFFLFIFGLFIYKGEQTNAWLRSWQQKKMRVWCVRLCNFLRACFNTFLLLFSCSLHTVVFGPGRWLSKKLKKGGHVQTEGGCVNMMCVLVCLQGKNLKNQEMTDM